MKFKRVNLYLPVELVIKSKIKALQEEKSLSKIVTIVLEKYTK